MATHRKSDRPFLIHTWDVEKITPELPGLNEDEIRAKDIAIEQACNLMFDFSLDPKWRKVLFQAKQGEKFNLPSDYFAFNQQVRDLGLKFAVYNDGWTDYGFIVFGIASVDFPDVGTFTVNNPEII